MFNLTIADSALQKIQEVLANKPAGYFFRINITSGGCSGFSTSFKIDNILTKEDITTTYGNINVVINKVIADFIRNAELEYRSNIISSSFYLQVKTAKETCSCGSSFGM